MENKHPTEIIQELDLKIHNLENLIMQYSNLLEINKSLVEKFKNQKQSLLNYLNENE